MKINRLEKFVGRYVGLISPTGMLFRREMRKTYRQTHGRIQSMCTNWSSSQPSETNNIVDVEGSFYSSTFVNVMEMEPYSLSSQPMLETSGSFEEGSDGQPTMADQLMALAENIDIPPEMEDFGEELLDQIPGSSIFLYSDASQF